MNIGPAALIRPNTGDVRFMFYTNPFLRGNLKYILFFSLAI